MPLNANPAVKLATTPVKEAEVNATPAPVPQQGGNMLEAIAKYRGYGQALKQTASMREIAAKLSEIADLAENAVVNEADDWFDQHTVKRNMKEIKGYSGDFAKLANEADLMNQRMAALYEDMGRVLERYFDLGDQDQNAAGEQDLGADDEGELSTAIAAAQSNEREVPSNNPASVQKLPEGKEAGKTKEDGNTKSSAVPIESPNADEPMKARSGKLLMDALTLRAIKSVHGRLQREGKHDAARKFRNLPPKMMERVVWKLTK